MRRRSLGRWLPAIPLVVGAVVVGVSLTTDDNPEPIGITSSAADFESLDDLVSASDLVVVATIVGVSDGRVITAPDDPQSGIRTRILTLDVSDVLVGSATDDIIVEEAAELVDGTPVVVDGVEPLPDGAEAVWFLVAGEAETMPYYSTVNRQGRFTVTGETLVPAADDALSEQLAGLGREGLLEAITDVTVS